MTQNYSIPRYTLFSHHPREQHQSPCASIFQLFIGKNRVQDLAGYLDVRWQNEQFARELRNQTVPGESHFLFNSFQSLLSDNSLAALESAVLHDIPVTIYWHETAWNLRQLAQKSPQNYRRLQQFAGALNVTNWVPTSQCMHAVATLFGFPIESFRIVYEVVDLERFTPKTKTLNQGPATIVGAALPDARKGVDIFIDIANEAKRQGLAATFKWYTPRDNKIFPDNAVGRDAVQWCGHAPDLEKHLQAADAFLLTSRDDPSPLVVFEALASGIPAFCFATTGFAEMLPSKFICHSLEEMLEKLQFHLANPISSEECRDLAIGYGVTDFVRRAYAVRSNSVVNTPYLDTPIETHDDLHELSETRLKSVARKEVSVRRRENVIRQTEAAAKIYAEEAVILRALLADARKAVKLRSMPASRHYLELRIRRKLKRLPRLKVCVVGNSPSLTGSGLGKFIDSCDVVIRINNFATKGYETDVGSKTTYAIISPACHPNKELSALPRDRIMVFGANMRNDFKRITARLNAANGAKVTPSEKNVLSPLLYVDMMKAELGLDMKAHMWPSTGIVAIQWALDFFGHMGDVFCQGFSFYSENQQTLTRYFGVDTKPDGKHNFAFEKAYFARLQAKGKIRSIPQ